MEIRLLLTGGKLKHRFGHARAIQSRQVQEILDRQRLPVGIQHQPDMRANRIVRMLEYGKVLAPRLITFAGTTDDRL